MSRSAAICLCFLMPARALAGSPQLKIQGSVRQWVEAETEPSPGTIKTGGMPPALFEQTEPEGILRIFLVHWGKNPFPYDMNSPHIIDYSAASEAQDSGDTGLAAVGGGWRRSVARGLMMTPVGLAATAAWGCASPSHAMILGNADEFVRYLEQAFRRATGGLMELEVDGVYGIPAAERGDEEDFLEVKPMEDHDCEPLLGTNNGEYYYENCLDNTRKRYRDFLVAESRPRLYYYEKKGGKNLDVMMFDEAMSAAQDNGWDPDTQVLVILHEPKYGAALNSGDTHFFITDGTSRNISVAAVEQPAEGFPAPAYEVPYFTKWRSKYDLADAVIHGLGHSMGLGHDCEGVDPGCEYAASVMSPRRDKPASDGERWVNQFSACDLGYLKSNYLNRVHDGGPSAGPVSGFSCP